MKKLIQKKIQANSLTYSDIKQLDYLDEDSKECPICQSSFVGKEIPHEHRHYYGEKTNYSKLIGIDLPHLYDGIIMWTCPNCRTYFRRFNSF